MRLHLLHLYHRLRTSGIDAGDSDELRMQKRLLALLGGLFSIAAGVWLLTYWLTGTDLPAFIPLLAQCVIALNMLAYAQWRNFVLYRNILISTLLIFPCIAQWALGDFVTASGLILWGMLAPITALLCLGMRESAPWFVAYLILVVLTGVADYLLPGVGLTQATISREVGVLFFTLNFATLSAVVFQCLRFSARERSRAQHLLEQAHAKLANEQARSERLLLNILPAPIADRLRASDDTIVDGCPEAVVMFADIVNFTGMASDLPPVEIFRILNHVFSKFDDLVEATGLEKIKTIGDAYMVAGGLSEAPGDSCAAMAELALEMRRWISEDATAAERGLQLRIGICCGPVVAGVVGRRKFIYDLWGDAVNLASRISSECPPGLIQCDSRTFAKLKYRFIFEDPVTLRLKGKGMVSVWRLLARGNDPAPEAPRYTTVDIDFSRLD
ncbi:adenylate/guanylate cyclase domain-containing protein [Uliginosibacterium paludis]|uniref:Adenylate/guanylate cyclase domain-containing protein n=1 Tax=Uliginosibacterium paludis TaxID=1615952 RepID=A0ABV2CUN5_9RHOO